MERVADLIVERRDELALTLTLDQGKPLHSEAYGEVDELVEYWRMAAADAKRLDGSMPPSVDASKRILGYRVPRGVVGVITPWNWPYTMPAELLAPGARCRQRRRLDAGVVDLDLRGEARRVHRRRRAARRRLLDGDGPRRRRRRRDRRQPGHARDRLHRLRRHRPEGRDASGRQGPPARARRQRADGRARGRRRRRGGRGEPRRLLPLRRPELHGGRALPRPRGRPRRVRRAAARGGRRARSGSATRCSRRRRWGRSTTSRPREKMDRARRRRARPRRRARRRRRPRRGFPTGLYWQATVLDRVTEEMEVAREETFGPVVPITTISSDDEALQIANASPYGLLTAVWTRDLAPRPALRRGRRRRLGEHQRVDELLGEPPARSAAASGKSSGVGRVGGRAGDGDVHRAEDRGGDALAPGETPARTLFNQDRR